MENVIFRTSEETEGNVIFRTIANDGGAIAGNSISELRRNAVSLKDRRFFISLACSVFLALCMGLFSACGDDNDDDNGNDNDNDNGDDIGSGGSGKVFVAGSSNGEPVLWVDGKMQRLPMGEGWGGRAYSVFVQGNDVYVAGNVIVDRDPIAVLWKNGLMQELDGREANSVFVSGNDVYVAGYSYSSGTLLWKNGERQELPYEMNGRPNSVFVSGDDVYVAGYDDSLSSSYIGVYYHAILWKNGERQVLGTGTEWIRANSVYVSGNDVYVAGFSYQRVQWGISSKPMLWKNGVVQELENDGIDANAHSVFVSGSDVYVAGWDGGKAILWKNGERQIIDDSGFAAVSVYVKDNEVYVVIVEYGVWKNGERLYRFNGGASIFVK